MNTEPEIDDGEFDLARLPYELRTVLESNWRPIQLVTPGTLSIGVDDEADEIIVFERGDEVGRFPRARLRDYNPQLLRPFVAAALQRCFTTHEADQLVAAVNNGEMVITAPADDDYVYVDIGTTKVTAVHRHCLVDGFPPKEDGE